MIDDIYEYDEEGNFIYEGVEKEIVNKIKAFNEKYDKAGFWTPAHIILQDYNIDKQYCQWAIEEIQAGRGIVWGDEFERMEQEEIDATITLLKEIVQMWVDSGDNSPDYDSTKERKSLGRVVIEEGDSASGFSAIIRMIENE